MTLKVQRSIMIGCRCLTKEISVDEAEEERNDKGMLKDESRSTL